VNPRCKRLPHEVPSWVDPSKEMYFITISCRERGRNQLAQVEIAEPLCDTVRHRQEKCVWWPYVFLLMPDHLHALISFPRDVSIPSTIANWKEIVAKRASVRWQRDFFDHRLRSEESYEEKANYIRMNPVRKKLVSYYLSQE